MLEVGITGDFRDKRGTEIVFEQADQSRDVDVPLAHRAGQGRDSTAFPIASFVGDLFQHPQVTRAVEEADHSQMALEETGDAATVRIAGVLGLAEALPAPAGQRGTRGYGSFPVTVARVGDFDAGGI